MSSESGASGPQSPREAPPSSQKAKRQQVLAACEHCRHQKIKCDGQPVCRECRRRGIQCVYATRGGESHGQATKRRADELTQTNHVFERIFKAMQNDEEEAITIFRNIRAGHRPEVILQDMLTGRLRPPVQTSYESQLRDAFLIALAQSTARLDVMVDLAAASLGPPQRANLPSPQAYHPLKDRIVTLDVIHEILATANPGQRPLSGRSPSEPSSDTNPLDEVPDGAHWGPTFWVPASPWTSLTANDEAVSHLVTIFLTHVNPYWRCVEEDLFLQGMRRPTEEPSYCSSLLVNAILACASLYSEIDEAFATAGNLLTRGDHFHQEAMKLWSLEGGKESVVNMQSLLVLALRTLPRGKCQLGWALIKAAAAQNRSLSRPAPVLGLRTDPQTANYARARACVANSIVSTNVAYALGLLAHTVELEVGIEDASELDALLPNTQVWWNGYPLKRHPVPFRQNLLMRQRWQLTCLAWDLLQILFSDHSPTPSQLWTAAAELIERLQQWYNALPNDLRFRRPMPTALYEFHAYCLCIFMTLYRQTYELLFMATNYPESDSSGIDWANVKNELRRQKLEYAFKAAYLSRDFGEEYGWKIAPPYIPQQAASAIFVFMQEMQESSTHNSQDNSLVNDIEKAFEECFRCLLGCSVQQMLTRGITRMIYHTASQLKLKIPKLIERMLEIVAETAWQPSDLNYLDSIFPNPLIANHPKAADKAHRMQALLKDWESEHSD